MIKLDNDKFDYIDVTLKSVVTSVVRVPNNLENEDELRAYLREYYSDAELVSDVSDVNIEEIEDYNYPRTEADDFDDKWHSAELS